MIRSYHAFSSGPVALFRFAMWLSIGLPVILLDVPRLNAQAAGLQAETTRPSSAAAPDDLKASNAEWRAYDAAVAKAIEFVRAQQAHDGGFASPADPGATALLATALMRHGISAEDPTVAKSLAYLERFVQKDGGVYRVETYYKNYESCLAILCFSEANATGKYDTVIENATAFVKKIQWDDGEDVSPDDPAYGGAGYGKHARPDLSNTQFLLDALHEAGDGDNFDSIQRALTFVSRCQNLESEHNPTKFPERNPDGGFYYTPAAGGSSQAGNTESGGLRSYGSMTYAGLKSMLYAGVGPDDKRVKAAMNWIRRNYDLTSNPGMGQAGLYYYYHTFAKALGATGQDTFEDESGTVHDWRSELRAVMIDKQRSDGSWVNEQDRWYEGDAKLVTGYGLLTLRYCRPERAP